MAAPLRLHRAEHSRAARAGQRFQSQSPAWRGETQSQHGRSSIAAPRTGTDAMNTAAAFADTMPAHWPTHAAAPAAGWTHSVSGLLARWLDASRSRRTLDDLDEHMLRDIGITRDEALREARKFFWQV
jgi:uncharacterized protein YjiS (DUF1127 family)